MFGKTKKKETKKEFKKTVITKRSLYAETIPKLIIGSLFFIFFLCVFIALVGPFFDFPLWCKLTVGIPALYLLINSFLYSLGAAIDTSTIKDSAIIITDAKITKMYKELSSLPEDFSWCYYVTLKCADKNVKELKIDSYLYDRVKIGSLCYYINVSDNVYPKNSYILGDDLLPYYKNEIE